MAKPHQPERLFISTKAAAIILGVHHRTLASWIREGKGPPVQRFGTGTRRMIRIIYPKFLKWIDNPSRNIRGRKQPQPPIQENANA